MNNVSELKLWHGNTFCIKKIKVRTIPKRQKVREIIQGLRTHDLQMGGAGTMW